jgi:transcriptional regulator with XRE-family HTH domain
MSSRYPIVTAEQLPAYLRALRKSQGLTQRELAERLGVSIARISTIEQNPGAVSLKQLTQLMHSLGARLTIETGTPDVPPVSASPEMRRRGEW